MHWIAHYFVSRALYDSLRYAGVPVLLLGVVGLVMWRRSR